MCLQAHIARDITPNVKLIQDIRRQGGNAKDVILIEGVRAENPGKGQEPYQIRSTFHILFLVVLSGTRVNGSTDIVRFYGSHCTKSALQNHFNRDLNPNVKILKGMVNQGLDPKDAVLIEGVRPGNPGKSQTFVISSTLHSYFSFYFSALSIDVLSEVARCYGKSVNGKAIRNFFDRTVKHDVKAVLDTLKAGGDPEDLQLSGIVKIGGGTKGQTCTNLQAHSTIFFFVSLSSLCFLHATDIDDPNAETAKCFGDGLKGHALSMHFQRNIRPASKLILEAIARGEDPAKTVPVGAEAKGSGAKG